VEERLLFLSSVFSIDICAYAVMSNNTHVVLCVNKDLAENWSTEEVVKRWHQLYQGTLLSQRYQRGDVLSKGVLISSRKNSDDLPPAFIRHQFAHASP
jgi:hypothetical protein